MKLYAELAGPRRAQAVADIALACWIAASVIGGRAIHGAAVSGSEGAVQLQHAGTTMSTNMGEAGRRLSKIPLVGDKVRDPFDRAARAGDQIADAGHGIVTGMDGLGMLLGFLTAGLLILAGTVLWGTYRLPRARRMSSATRLRSAPGGFRALALQALADPSREGPAIPPDTQLPALFGDDELVRELAHARLRSLGLKPIEGSVNQS